jgi:hypothetical protein
MRCIVCLAQPTSHRRSLDRTFVGQGAEMRFRLDYCADRAECGEQAAVGLLEKVAGVFFTDDLPEPS